MLTLLGPNGTPIRTVYANGEEIGMVTKNPCSGMWTATANGANHGDRYISDWAAAKQLALALRKS